VCSSDLTFLAAHAMPPEYKNNPNGYVKLICEKMLPDLFKWRRYGYIDEDIQLLTYEREKWRAKESPKYQKGFADLGVTMPTDFFKEIEAKADEFKAVNERLAPTRSFLMPKHKDATVEAFIRSRYATEKKSVQILKIGLDDASWVIHRNSLGIPTSQTKVVRLLVKVPNRPFCQEHSIAAERKYQGGKYGALSVDGGKVGAEGAFMKCE